MGRPRLNAEALAPAVEAALDGVSYAEAAVLFAVSATSVRRAVKESGLPRRRVPKAGRRPLSAEVVRVALEAVAAGETVEAAAAAAGIAVSTVRAYLIDDRGVMQTHKPRPDELTDHEREEIRVGIELKESDTEIAERLGRDRSTIWREIRRNGGRDRYQACAAKQRAADQARRPKARWFEERPELWDTVRDKMRDDTWSPESVAAWLRKTRAEQPKCYVSHEAIYQAVYVQARGELRKELLGCLRSGRVRRKPQGRAHRGVGAAPKIIGMVNISERPPEVADRAVPGHLEGDLVVGADGKSFVATLVERTSRYGLAIKLDSKNAEHVAARIAEHIVTLPQHLMRSLTWDQGTELADHATFTILSGCPVFFADPHSPWQRPSNENWNGHLRYFLPKGKDLSIYSQDDLDTFARKINGRPRKILGWKTAAEVFNELVALTG